MSSLTGVWYLAGLTSGNLNKANHLRPSFPPLKSSFVGLSFPISAPTHSTDDLSLFMSVNPPIFLTPSQGRRNSSHRRLYIYTLLLSHIFFFPTHTICTRRSHIHYTPSPHSLYILCLSIPSYYTEYSPSVQLRYLRYPHLLLLPLLAATSYLCYSDPFLNYTIRIFTLTTLLIIATFLT